MHTWIRNIHARDVRSLHRGVLNSPRLPQSFDSDQPTAPIGVSGRPAATTTRLESANPARMRRPRLAEQKAVPNSIRARLHLALDSNRQSPLRSGVSAWPGRRRQGRRLRPDRPPAPLQRPSGTWRRTSLPGCPARRQGKKVSHSHVTGFCTWAPPQLGSRDSGLARFPTKARLPLTCWAVEDACCSLFDPCV